MPSTKVREWASTFSVPPSQLDESHNLEADYREDARHDIEDDAADEHEEHDFPRPISGGAGMEAEDSGADSVPAAVA
ncbi:hypothetical protein M5E88_03310 [Akkermansia muciniphila]|nr:hypothetical protein M5E88_03310 [Akkermansia muciniphila]